MADQTRNMLVKITGDSSEFKRAMADVNDSNTTTQSSFKNLAAGVAAGMAGFEIFSQALHKVSGFFADSSKAADAQDLALARLSNGINNVKSATDKHIGSLVNQAQALERSTRFSDEQIESGQGMLSTFQLNQTAIQALTPRLLDMSEGLAHVTGEMPDLESNAILVGKAIGGEDTAGLAGALRRVGVIMTDEQKNILTYGDMQQRLGVITQILDQNFKGMAVSAGDTAAGGMAKLHNQVDNVQESIGNMEHALSMGLVGAITNLVGNNTQMIGSLIVAGGAMLTFGAAVFAVTKLIQMFGIESMIAALTNPLTAALLAVGALLGVFVYNSMNRLQEKMKTTTDSALNLGTGMQNAIPQGASAATKAMSDLQDQLEKIDDQMNKANRDFREQLAEMVKSSQDKVKSLGEQLTQEKEDFESAQQDKAQSFADTNQNELDAHQSKVDQLEKQIQKQLSMGKSADAATLASLQQELQRENDQYNKQQQEQQAKYDKDVAAAQAAHDKKMADLQAQLDQENTMLTAHAADVAGIRQSDFVDEITKLKRSHDEQMKALDQQKADIIKNAKDTTGGIMDNYNSLAQQLAGNTDPMTTAGKNLGNAMSNALKDALKEGLKDTAKGVGHFFDAVGRFIVKGFDPREPASKSLSQLWSEANSDASQDFGHRAGGGPVVAGQTYVVNEGGVEYFTPDRDGYVLSSDKTASMLQGGTAAPQQVTQHISTFQLTVDVGMYAGMPAEKRQIAGQIWIEIVRIAKAQGVVLPQIGLPIQ